MANKGKFKEACIAFADQHKGVRRTMLAIIMLWVSAAVGVGLYTMTIRPLTLHDVSLVLGVVGLMQIPIGLYFNTRGKE